ncbi:hypothetical protein [Streptomyces sp. NPDC048527]|uniref:hypothetical protein n=1 Tax=Streptomyces sp. NPDC048527 TaxID=3365568 RepID=UPI0037120DD2
MTLFELQEWLGHRTPEATTHYAKLTPNTLARAYNDVGYFARNVRTIEVLVDRDAVTSGAAASGEPWQYFDLGHGWCAYTFFEQCQHRHGLRTLRLLHAEGLEQGAAAGGEGESAEDAGQHPSDGRRTRCGRRRPGRPGSTPGTTHRHPHSLGTDTSSDRCPRYCNIAADRRRPSGQDGIFLAKPIPQKPSNSDKAIRMVRTAWEAAEFPTSHPRCRRAFGPRPDSVRID